MTHTIKHVCLTSTFCRGGLTVAPGCQLYGRILSTRAVSCQIVYSNALSRPIYRKIFGTTISTALILLSLFSVFEISTIIRTVQQREALACACAGGVDINMTYCSRACGCSDGVECRVDIKEPFTECQLAEHCRQLTFRFS